MIKYVKYKEGHYKALFDMINKLYIEYPEVTPSNNKGLNFYKTLGFKKAENRFIELTPKD